MQYTDKYKLNLIETSDAFSPDVLNENTRKVEDVLAAQSAAEATARDAADGALDQRLTVLEGRRLVVGTYTGNGNKNGMHVELGFTPAVLLVTGTYYLFAVTPDSPYIPQPMQTALKIEEGGFFAAHDRNNKTKYFFIAIL